MVEVGVGKGKFVAGRPDVFPSSGCVFPSSGCVPPLGWEALVALGSHLCLYSSVVWSGTSLSALHAPKAALILVTDWEASAMGAAEYLAEMGDLCVYRWEG